MYIHIGGDITLPSDKIIGIFDIEKTSVNKDVNELSYETAEAGQDLLCFLRYAKELYCDKGLCIYLKRVGFYAENAVCWIMK